jgi:hypothetical protein
LTLFHTTLSSFLKTSIRFSYVCCSLHPKVLSPSTCESAFSSPRTTNAADLSPCAPLCVPKHPPPKNYAEKTSSFNFYDATSAYPQCINPSICGLYSYNTMAFSSIETDVPTGHGCFLSCKSHTGEVPCPPAARPFA